MLVLTRKPREEIRIGNGITITVLRVKGQSVRIGIDAPSDVRIIRGELEFELDEAHEKTFAANEKCTTTANSQDEKQRPQPDRQAERKMTFNDSGHNRLNSVEPPPVVSSCRIPRPPGNRSMLQILAARQRAKLQRENGGLQLPPR